jgi:carboxymethylenebutenolidase
MIGAPGSSSAYFISPERPGPGVLLLHSWWGLSSFTKKLADRLSDEGFTVLAPDLFSGKTPSTQAEAEETLRDADPNHLAATTLSAVSILARKSPTFAIIGLGMGGSLGLWASVRAPDVVNRVVSFYGTQNIDFVGSRSEYLVHLAENDPWVTADDSAFMQTTMGLEGLPVELVDYPGTSHGFFEQGEGFDPEAAESAWQKTLEFLRR